MIFGGWLGILFSKDKKKLNTEGTEVGTRRAQRRFRRERRFFYRGGPGRLPGTCGDWGGWRWPGRWRCGCARVAIAGCPARGVVARHSWVRVPTRPWGFLWIRPEFLRLCFPSLLPYLYFDIKRRECR